MEMELVSKYTDEILEVIEDQMSTDRDLTQSDLQGRVGAIVMNILREGKKLKSKE